MRPLKRYVIGIVAALVCAGAVSVLIVTQIENVTAAPASSSSQPPASSSVSEPVFSSAPEPEPERLRYIEHGELELPVEGATGYTIIDTVLWPQPAEEGEGLNLFPGSCFAILAEQGEWWNIEGEGFTGWVKSAICMVNLPDVIPSIVYDDANAYSSVFLSCGKDIPGITGQALYEARGYNARLDCDEFVMPVLYPMAKKICTAQQAALADGNTLVVIEAYRPWSAQQAVVQAITALAAEDEEVMRAISDAPWSTDWFIATGISNHQQGYAVDLTIAKVDATEEHGCGLYDYTRVSASTRYAMQTPIHELSPASASMAVPIDPRSPDWRTVAPAAGMNPSATLLQQYMTDAGMTPLPSEWWHFNDYTAFTPEIQSQARGNFHTSACRSFTPGQEA